MSKKTLENIKNEDIKMNKDGELEVSEELQSQIDEVAGGVSPEESEEEDLVINIFCQGEQVK